MQSTRETISFFNPHVEIRDLIGRWHLSVNANYSVIVTLDILYSLSLETMRFVADVKQLWGLITVSDAYYCTKSLFVFVFEIIIIIFVIRVDVTLQRK